MTRLQSLAIYPELKAYLTLAIPLGLAQLIEISMLTVDTWTMGILGRQILAAGALGYAAFRFLSLISYCIISATNTVASIAFGANKNYKVNGILIQGFWLAILLSIPVMIILGTSSIWMSLLGQERTNIILCQDYLQSLLWGIPALFFYEVIRNVLTAINSPKIITVIAGLSIFINAALNYILAFGKLGLPSLGLAGIGWATTIVLWLQLLISLVFIYCNPDFKNYQFLRQDFRFDKSVFLEIFRIGWPSGADYIAAGSFMTTLVYLFSYFGSEALAAFQITYQVDLLIRYTVAGFSQAIVARVGLMYGSQDRKGVRRSGLVGISTSMLIVAFCMVAIALNREAIVSIFITPKTEADLKVFQLASKFLIILAAMQLLNELETTAIAALQGIKDTFVPMIIGIVSYWGVGLSSAYFLIFYGHLQSAGLLISLYLATLVPAVTLSLRFYFKTSDVTSILFPEQSA